MTEPVCGTSPEDPPCLSMGEIKIDGCCVSLASLVTDKGLYLCTVYLHTWDPFTGGYFRVERERIIPKTVPYPVLVQQVRNLMYEAFQHEVDEWLRANGHIVTMPHPEAPLPGETPVLMGG